MKKLNQSMRALLAAGTVAGALLGANTAHAANDYGVYITEWMYQSASSNEAGEFIEFTNLGTEAVDFTGWSYDDDSRIPLVFRLSAFGVVDPGESVILTEISASLFRERWGLDESVKVIGGYTNNLGNGDEINLFDANQQLVDRLTYDSTPRTRYVSGRPTSIDAIGANTNDLWVLSSVGDIENSWQSTVGDIGSPGYTSFAPVPEPETYALMLAGLGLVGALARRKAAKKA